MSLSPEQIQQRRNLSAENIRNQDIFRIAESLENIDASLRAIAEHLQSGSGNPLAK